jgi:hypothetical protein
MGGLVSPLPEPLSDVVSVAVPLSTPEPLSDVVSAAVPLSTPEPLSNVVSAAVPLSTPEPLSNVVSAVEAVSGTVPLSMPEPPSALVSAAAEPPSEEGEAPQPWLAAASAKRAARRSRFMVERVAGLAEPRKSPAARRGPD